MPSRDGTGPKGVGPLTGTGSGKCAIPLNTREEEMAYLKNHAEVLRKELNKIERRIAALENLNSK